MKRAESQLVAKRICQYYDAVGRDMARVYDHFGAENIDKRTIRRIIARYRESGSFEYKNLPGRPKSVRNSSTSKQVLSAFQQNPCVSERILAQKLNVSRSTVQRIKKEGGLRSFVRQKVPKYVGDQLIRCKSGARKLYEKLTESPDLVIIIDDETYVPKDPADIPGKSFYSAQNRENVDPDIKFIGKKKFTPKFLVWQAIDSLGNVSEPYVHEGTIDALSYRYILETYLLPFIDAHHNRQNILFWPDMATSYYAASVLAFLRSEGISFVEKKRNLPNCPQARPIEKFWALCKSELKKSSYIYSNIESFRKRWTTISSNVASKSGAELMRNLKQKLRRISRQGAYSAINM